MRKLWCLEVEKIGEKISYGISNFFFLKTNGGKWEYLKGRERRNISANHRRPHHPWAVWGVWATQDQRAGLAVWHTASTRGGLAKANGHGCFSRAPRTFFDRMWASELRFRIHFWITNRDFLMHNDDYETLTNGWEFISENDDKHNSTNENEK